MFGPPTWAEHILSSEWEKVGADNVVFPYTGPPPGPVQHVARDALPADLFNRFFSDEVWDLLVVETNRYADQVRTKFAAQNPTKTQRAWHPVTNEEMKAFLGMFMLMGIATLPRLELYWTTKHPLIRPNLHEIMSQKRFEQILRYLHLNDSDSQVARGQDGFDILFKVRKLLDLICPLLASEYNTHEQLCIDEAMIPFKGRLGFKQYMKDKPTKWGIKVWVLADAKTGYVPRIQIYTGKNEDLDQAENMGLSSKVVVALLHGYGRYHPKTYMDNFYTSPSLFIDLYQKGINACGTARKNRKFFPKELATVTNKVDAGYYDYRSSGPLLAMVWKDKKIIHFMSTMHNSEGPSVVPRIQKDGTRVRVACPPCLPDYQAYMRGVDRADQMIGYYNLGRRSLKWWKRVFFYLIEVAALNAYILSVHGKLGERISARDDYMSFRIRLGEQLVGSFSSRRGPRHASVEDVRLKFDANHKHSPEGVGTSRRSDCVVCRKLGLRHASTIICGTCKVHLCVKPERNCYSRFHS